MSEHTCQACIYWIPMVSGQRGRCAYHTGDYSRANVANTLARPNTKAEHTCQNHRRRLEAMNDPHS